MPTGRPKIGLPEDGKRRQGRRMTPEESRATAHDGERGLTFGARHDYNRDK